MRFEEIVIREKTAQLPMNGKVAFLLDLRHRIFEQPRRQLGREEGFLDRESTPISMADTDEIIDDALDRFESVLTSTI